MASLLVRPGDAQERVDVYQSFFDGSTARSFIVDGDETPALVLELGDADCTVTIRRVVLSDKLKAGRDAARADAAAADKAAADEAARLKRETDEKAVDKQARAEAEARAKTEAAADRGGDA